MPVIPEGMKRITFNKRAGMRAFTKSNDIVIDGVEYLVGETNEGWVIIKNMDSGFVYREEGVDVFEKGSLINNTWVTTNVDDYKTLLTIVNDHIISKKD